MDKIFDLNGVWDFAFFDKQKMEAVDPETVCLTELMAVPGCFDCMPDHYCQRGCAVYSRTFTLEEEWTSCWLRVEGMGLRGRFFIDGRSVGYSSLPYSTFELECGALSAGEHRITALLDNNFDPEKMKLFLPFYDFYAFGGFYHGVSLRLSKESNPLDRIFVRTVDFRTGKLNLEFVFKYAAPEKFTVRMAINGEAEKEYEVTNASLDLERADLPLWSPDSPVLHTLRAQIGSDTVSETFGIREVSTENGKIMLNGKPVYLKGFNRHESAPISGAATNPQQMLLDLQHLKSLNANFIRGAHYPQSREFLSLCDRMGFLVWEESLGWGNTASQMQDEDFIQQQVEQTRLMVRNSFNHPCVIIYGFLNENFSMEDAGVEICKKLADTIRAEKSGRLVTFANCHNYLDRALEYMDILTSNTYPGWIQADMDTDPCEAIAPEVENTLRHLRELHGYGKPILISEMGCCGIYGHHDEAAAQWTEEFQAGYLTEVIDAVFSSSDVAGLALWQFNDAKSYHRTGAVIRCKPLSQNLAGVYDQYRRPKLAAQIVADKFKKKTC